MPKLEFLTTNGNPFEAKKGYRLFVIGAVPQVRTLDHTRIDIIEYELFSFQYDIIESGVCTGAVYMVEKQPTSPKPQSPKNNYMKTNESGDQGREAQGGVVLRGLL